MGDFNIDLLKDDVHRPIHDYLDLVFSHSLIPTIYKHTRITEHIATIIDNILTNTDNIAESAIIVTDITDHMYLSVILILKRNLNQNRMHCINEGIISIFSRVICKKKNGKLY